MAKAFATVHYETVIRKHHLPAGSRFIGQPGERLTDLHLEVLGTRLQLDAYKTTGYYVDQSVLAADADGNRYTFIIKAAASSMSPEMLTAIQRKSILMKVYILNRPKSFLIMRVKELNILA